MSTYKAAYESVHAYPRTSDCWISEWLQAILVRIQVMRRSAIGVSTDFVTNVQQPDAPAKQGEIPELSTSRQIGRAATHEAACTALRERDDGARRDQCTWGGRPMELAPTHWYRSVSSCGVAIRARHGCPAEK